MQRLLTWLCGLIVMCGGAVAAADPQKPNVLIFLADDEGWGELGCQGNSEIPTPHIDSIAKNGVRFTQGYVSGPYCSPTRAGLMTGRYQTRFGHEFNSVARHAGLSLNETTFANRMQSLGYATCAIGKWHLGQNPEFRPWRRGFDEFFGTLNNTPFFHPTMFVDTRISNEVRQVEDDSFYTTDEYAKRAVDWIGKQQGKPWFVYLPFNAQHAPLQATKKYLDRFPNITDEKRRLFAAMMSAKDDAVGQVLSKVRELGQEDNTLVVYLADNGGPTASTTSKNGALRGFKATTWEGGVRVPFLLQWKGNNHIPVGKTYEQPVIQLDLLPTAIAAAGGTVDPAWKIDGVNLLPYLTGENKGRPHETLYWRFGAQWAIRHADFKLVVGNGGGKEPELYNLASDISETKNLAAENPDKTRELKTLWDTWNAEQVPASHVREDAAPKKKAIQRKKKKEAAAA